MAIINISKNCILAEKVLRADTCFKRLKGLLGRSRLGENEALVIIPGNSIHTFFMRFPIDVLFVNKNNKIIKIATFLRPFRISPVYFHSSYVVELPAGKVQSTNTSPGDLLGDGSP